MKIHSKPAIEPEVSIHKPNPMPFLFLALLAVVALVFAYKHFDEAFDEVEGELVMKPQYREKIDKRVTKPFDCETYELRANISGLYPCKACEGGVFYLNAGEVFKIGESCNKEERYSQGYYASESLKYFVVLKGNAAECKAEEARRLGAYPTTPENLARPNRTPESIQNQRYRLLYPIGNTGIK